MQGRLTQRLKQSISVVVMVFMLLVLLPVTKVAAAETIVTLIIDEATGVTITVIDDGTTMNVTGGRYTGPALSIANTRLVITGSSTANGIVVTDNSGSQALPVVIQLGNDSTGLTIDRSTTSDATAFALLNDAKVKLYGSPAAAQEVNLISGYYHAGLEVPAGTELEYAGGYLKEARGGQYGAGIGGGYHSDGGTITISGGTIASAQGGSGTFGSGAGIGGGYGGAGGTITISGGTIASALGGQYGAGIGGGYDGAGGTITISGGIITSAQGSRNGAGIGGGQSGAGGTITISGGTIASAQGGDGGAGIGGGDGRDGGTIAISDGTITNTQGGYGGAGIGGGTGGAGGTITIGGGTITNTQGGNTGAGIGGGTGGAGGTIAISGGTITSALGGYGSAGIGGGYYRAGGNITISGGTITGAQGGDGGAGIGGGYGGTGGNITISGSANVKAKGGNGAQGTMFSGVVYEIYGAGAGIGGGSGDPSSAAPSLDSITIHSGVTINATGGSGIAANGEDGYWGNSGTTDRNGYSGGGAAIGGGGGAAKSAIFSSPSLEPPGGGITTIVTLPVGLVGLTLTGGAGGADGSNQGGGNGATIGEGGTAFIGLAPSTGLDGTSAVGYETNTKQTTPNVSIDYVAETLTGFTSGEKYSFNGGAEETISAASAAIYTALYGETIAIVHKGDGITTVDSLPQSLPIPARPSQPIVTGVNETVTGQNDGKITGVGNTMQYRLGSSSTWTDVTGSEITGLAPGSYQVRVKAVVSTSFASTAATVTIATGAAPTYTLNVTAPLFSSIAEGDAQPAAQAVTIASSGNSDATIATVGVSGTAFVISGSGNTVTAGGSITTWAVQPVAGLTPGSYTENITVTYDGGATATATVSFLVNPATYTVTVNGGIGDGNYAAGVTVPVAASIPAGKQFVEWKSADDITFANPSSAITSFTMPAHAVTVTATFKDISAQASYRIIYDENWGGHGSTRIQDQVGYTVGQSVTLRSAGEVPARSGYTFTGWNTQANGGGHKVHRRHKLYLWQRRPAAVCTVALKQCLQCTGNHNQFCKFFFCGKLLQRNLFAEHGKQFFFKHGSSDRRQLANRRHTPG